MEYEYRCFWDIKVSREVVVNNHNGTAFIREVTIKEGVQHVNYLPING